MSYFLCSPAVAEKSATVCDLLLHPTQWTEIELALPPQQGVYISYSETETSADPIFLWTGRAGDSLLQKSLHTTGAEFTVKGRVLAHSHISITVVLVRLFQGRKVFSSLSTNACMAHQSCMYLAAFFVPLTGIDVSDGCIVAVQPACFNPPERL